MAEYIVSARKYRPVSFSEMVGQEQVATTLKNAIRTGHLAHSFLFCGPRGVGKTTAARILAKTINCENITADFEACGQCNSCISFQQNSSFNIHELDAASNNTVDDIRALVDQVRFPPQSGKYKIYIIDEVHMLSTSAFNAFLKTLEEPPSYCKFILATTEKHKILPTILSRCQIFDFKRIGIDVIVKHLKHICEAEKIEAEEDALHIIAQKADGGMRDALSMFDRLSSFSGGKLTYVSVLENLNVLDYDYFFKVTDALLSENLALSVTLFDEILKKGFEGDDFILGLCEHFRNLLFCKDEGTLKMLEVSENLKQKYAVQSALASSDFLVNCLNIGNQCDVQYKVTKNKRLTVELTLIKMCYINAVVSIDAGKKKLKSEGINSREHQPDTEKAKPEVNNAPQPAVNGNGPDGGKPNLVEEGPVTPVQKPVKQTPPDAVNAAKPVVLPKTKKLLTADSIHEETDAFKKNGTDQPAEEKYEGDILILDQSNISKLWNEYASKIPEEKRGLKIAFGSFKPVLDTATMSKVSVTVQSNIQKSQIDEVRTGLQNYLSKRTGTNLELEIIADKEVSNGVKPYTPKEKLERMIQKNPAIKTMQQKFGLELDYD